MRSPFGMTRFLSVSTVAALMVLTAACGSSSSNSPSKSTPKPAKGVQTANVLNSQQQTGDADWVQTLDPAVVTDSISISNVWLIDANLVKLSYPSLSVIPDLASKWDISPDKKTYTFHLRPNAKFSNGDPVTADDVVFSITRALLPATKSPVAQLYLGEIVGAADVASGKAKTLAGVKAVDAHTVKITLSDPIAYFLGTLSYPTADVLDKKIMQGKPAASYLTNTCSGNIGAGPFKPVCRNNSSSKTSFYPSGHSAFIDYVPNPNFYGAKPKIKIHAPFIADSETNWRLYQAGSIDETIVPSPDIQIAQKMKGFVKVPALETDYISLNQKEAPFNNKNCRLAVAYAIDRENITTKLLRGIEYPLYDVIPKGMPNGGQGYFGKSPDAPSYNPTKAKQYLAQCPGGLKNVPVVYQKTSQDIVHEYDAIRANLQAIGADIAPKPLTFNAWLTDVTSPMSQTHAKFAENLWIDDYPDAQDWLQNLLMTGANDNIGEFNNPQYDALVKKGNVEQDPATRAQIYSQAQKLAVNDGAWVGVGGVYSLYVVSPRVHGIIISSGLPLPKNNDWSQVSLST